MGVEEKWEGLVAVWCLYEGCLGEVDVGWCFWGRFENLGGVERRVGGRKEGGVKEVGLMGGRVEEEGVMEGGVE